MTLSEAQKFIRDFYYSDHPTEEQEFLFEESLKYLIDLYHDPQHMHNLACFYLERKRHDLELKYLEMAAEYDYLPAIEELGYVWYYGQNGEVDYEKAYGYFERGANSDDDVVKMWCGYKLADMYHNGFYVEKDEEKYRAMIEALYARLRNPGRMQSVYPNPQGNLPYSEVIWRLAKIRVDEGRIDEAKDLLHETRRRLSEEIHSNPGWWGNIDVMDQVVRLEHDIGGVEARPDLYDICWMIDEECTVAFLYRARRFLIKVVHDEDSGKNVIEFDGKWSKTARDFLEKAAIDGKKLGYLYDLFYSLEVTYG